MIRSHRMVVLMAALGLGALSSAWASGEPEQAPRYNFQDFDAIDVQAGIQVEVLSGDFKVELVQCPKPGQLDVRQSGRTVVFGFKPLSWNTSFGPTKFKVWVPRLRGLTLSGGAGAQFYGTTGDDLVVDLSGGSHGSGTFKGGRLSVQLGGGSVLDLGGEAQAASVQSSGGAQFHGRNFIAEEADVRVSGGAGAQLKILQRARLDASGGASIEYSGRPTVQQDVSGGARVRSVGN